MIFALELDKASSKGVCDKVLWVDNHTKVASILNDVGVCPSFGIQIGAIA